MTRDERIEQAKRLLWESDAGLAALAALMAERTEYTADECKLLLVVALLLEVEKRCDACEVGEDRQKGGWGEGLTKQAREAPGFSHGRLVDAWEER